MFTENGLILKVKETVEKYGMLDSGDKVMVSVSGGPDSVFLLHVLLALRKQYGLGLYVFHLDHLTRGGQSSKDAEFVRALCIKEGLPLKLCEKDCSKWSRQRKMSFQEGARTLRMNLLRDAAKQAGAGKIAVGHNADDNAETFFLNLFRGAGLTGLAAIKPVSGSIIRPLIEVYRQDIEDYLKANSINYCLDRTNLETVYARNKIRNLLFPFIEKEFKPRFKENISRLISLAREEDSFMNEAADRQLRANAHFYGKGKNICLLKLEAAFLSSLPDALKRRVIRKAVDMVKGDTRDMTMENVEQILGIAGSSESRSQQPFREIIVFLEQGYLYFVNMDKEDSIPARFRSFLRDRPFEARLTVGGKINFLKIPGIKVAAEVKEGVLPREYSKAEAMEAFMDYDKIKFPVKIRNWKKGDSFYPLGTGGKKKLQDFFTDQKIPGHIRKQIPVFADEEKIIWVGGCRIDHRVRIGRKTKKVLHIKLF